MDLVRLADLGPTLRGTPHVIGYHDDIGYWLLLGEVARDWREIWPESRARPARLPV